MSRANAPGGSGGVLPSGGAAAAPGFALPSLMGHRGAALHAPENTLAGLRKAAALGLSWVEFDVMLTGDGVPVLFHDDSLKRITGVPALMAETPLARLATLDAGRWFGEAFAGERVPTLEAALALLLKLGLQPNVEIKPTPGRDVETAVAAIEVLQRCWPAARPAPLISSFNRMSLAAACALRPDWPRALVAFKAPADWALALRALKCRAFHLSEKHLTGKLAARIKDAGYQVACYTVNDPRRAAKLSGGLVDCLISDAPDRIAAAFAG
ncbi:MAG: glycerophosphodiester phosphodiesterase family protein [Kiloniellales bacterium]